MGRVLAFDFGTKRTGIAVTDVLGMIANPLDSISTSEVLDFVDQYLHKENVDEFVLGEPQDLKGGDTNSSEAVRAFAAKLKKRFPNIPLVFIDERFTSRIASQTIAASGVSKSRRRDKLLVDKVSAVLILQSYLENKDFIKNRART